MDQQITGKFISHKRKEKNLTQEQLAEKLGVDFHIADIHGRLLSKRCQFKVIIACPSPPRKSREIITLFPFGLIDSNSGNFTKH